MKDIASAEGKIRSGEEARVNHQVAGSQFPDQFQGVQVGLPTGQADYQAWQHASDAVAGLQAAARGTCVLPGLENMGYSGTSLFSKDEYITFGEQFESAGYLVDTGHANLNGWNLAALLEQTKPRLTGIHLHDNQGNEDRHLPVGEGSIPWLDVFPLLGGLRCPLILEYAPGTPLAASRAFIERETRRRH